MLALTHYLLQWLRHCCAASQPAASYSSTAPSTSLSATPPTVLRLCCRYKGLSVELDAPLGTIPLHMLGGTILPMQRAGMTTSEVKASPLTLVVALPWPAEPAGAAGEGGARRAQQRASGRMYNDDGESAEVG